MWGRRPQVQSVVIDQQAGSGEANEVDVAEDRTRQPSEGMSCAICYADS